MALTEKYTGKLTEALVLARTRAPDLDSVCKLNCWGSSIKDVSIVRDMPNLEVCSVSVNEIDTLQHFAHCPNLQELYIRKNNVRHITDIQYLKKLSKLRVLWLSENPCSSGEKYRMTVLKNLPNLQKLDNVAVTEDELQHAKELGEDLPTLSLSPPATQPITSLHAENSDRSEGEAQLIPDTVTAENGDVRPGETNTVEERSADESVENPAGEQPNTSGGVNKLMNDRPSDRGDKKEEAVTLSWEETNRIREQLGLKPLPKTVMMSAKSVPTHHTKARNANILQSVLLLIKELDRDSLEVVHTAVKTRMESL